MNNFHLLAKGVDVSTLMHQIFSKPELWDENTLRTKDTNHSEVSDIWVWFNKATDKEKLLNDKVVYPYKAWQELPALRGILFPLMRQVEAVRLGRVVITKLPPGKEITPHIDEGSAAEYYKRYQIALQCLPGNIFTIGDEEISFETGEVWAINNRVIHSVKNYSSDDRIVCIVDLRLG